MDATVLDDIVGVERVHNAELLKMTLISSGRPLDVVVPVEAAAKLVVRFLDVFRQDGRSLEERRNLSEPEFAGGVQLLQVSESAVECPATSHEQLHLALLLADGLVLNFGLSEQAMNALAQQCQSLTPEQPC